MLARSPTVLYVEDDDGDRFFMGHAFGTAGLNSSLQIVQDGNSAIAYLAGTGTYRDRSLHPVPALVLLDLNLPQVSGFEVLAWIRQQPDYAKLPVVILSSSPLDTDRAAARALGADDYWEKPNSGMLYSKIVNSLCEKWLSASSSDSKAPAGGNNGRI